VVWQQVKATFGNAAFAATVSGDHITEMYYGTPQELQQRRNISARVFLSLCKTFEITKYNIQYLPREDA
jgi:hypothetical protein